MSDKKFAGAPFGTQKSRFDVAGIHPKRRPPGTITQVSYDAKSTSPLKKGTSQVVDVKNQSRKLGPGTYDIDNGSFSTKRVQEKAAGPGWQRAYNTSQAAKIPHLLYREEWERKQLQKCLLGPGTYNIPDSFDGLTKKPRSTRGVCETKAQRFSNSLGTEVPGPGTYGKGGIPHALLEEKQLKSASTVGMLDGGSAERQLPEVGSALCPGQYNCKSFIDELSERVISKRGPYDLFTGDRNKAITTGHFAAPKRSHLGPGEYEIKSFLDVQNSQHKKRHGKFGKVERFPDVPSDRIHCKTLSQWPRKSNEPGPGTYDPEELTSSKHAKRPPFGSSAKRNDRKAAVIAVNVPGPGRYNARQWQEKQHNNGSQSVFNSNTKRWDPIRDKYLMERIRSKDIPLKDRVFIVPVH